MHSHNTGSILLTLIQGEEGRQWAKGKKGWDSFTVDPVCTWEGVLCDEKAGETVEAIFLPKSSLPGTIPTEFGLLTELKAITIPQGRLRGTIPTEVAKLPRLEILNLAQNKLTGTIPYFESPALRSLDLGYNRLTGTLLPDICKNKNKMTDFDVIHNKISGEIPSCFSTMGSLVTLSISENRLSGTIPSSLGKLVVLEYLYLDNNNLMGMIPPSIARVDSALREFWLQENLLSGTIPASVADIKNLKDFYVDGNKFTGTVPSDLCRPEINSDFFDNVDASVKRDYCQSIACPANTVSVEGVYPCVPCSAKYYNPYLGRVGKCTTLNQREILQNLFDSAHGDNWIGAQNWAIHDDTFICDFTGITCDSNNHVTAIDLKGRGLTGSIPGSIGFLKYLTKLDLSDNNLTGYLPSDLRWAPLETLDISGNKMRGVVPSTLCLKSFVNENGEAGDYNCDNIACPVGYYSPVGHATKGRPCLKCDDATANFIGLNSCRHHASTHHQKGGAKAFAAILFISGIIGSIVYALMLILQKKRNEIDHEFSMQVKEEREPSIQRPSRSKTKNSDDYSFVPHDLDEDETSVHSASGQSALSGSSGSSIKSPPKRKESVNHNMDWLDVPDI